MCSNSVMRRILPTTQGFSGCASDIIVGVAVPSLSASVTGVWSASLACVVRSTDGSIVVLGLGESSPSQLHNCLSAYIVALLDSLPFHNVTVQVVVDSPLPEWNTSITATLRNVLQLDNVFVRSLCDEDSWARSDLFVQSLEKGRLKVFSKCVHLHLLPELMALIDHKYPIGGADRDISRGRLGDLLHALEVAHAAVGSLCTITDLKKVQMKTLLQRHRRQPTTFSLETVHELPIHALQEQQQHSLDPVHQPFLRSVLTTAAAADEPTALLTMETAHQVASRRRKNMIETLLTSDPLTIVREKRPSVRPPALTNKPSAAALPHGYTAMTVQEVVQRWPDSEPCEHPPPVLQKDVWSVTLQPQNCDSGLPFVVYIKDSLDVYEYGYVDRRLCPIPIVQEEEECEHPSTTSTVLPDGFNPVLSVTDFDDRSPVCVHVIARPPGL